jgi:hypothetical protein
MFKWPKKVEIALPEKIGNHRLFVGRKEELDVIPFYFSIRDSDQTLGMFATDFFAEKDLYTTMAGYIKGEAKEAIARYATFTQTKINGESLEKIWELTRGDPLYIKALFISRYNKKKDYTHDENIIEVYEKEISEGEIYTTRSHCR